MYFEMARRKNEQFGVLDANPSFTIDVLRGGEHIATTPAPKKSLRRIIFEKGILLIFSSSSRFLPGVMFQVSNISQGRTSLSTRHSFRISLSRCLLVSTSLFRSKRCSSHCVRFLVPCLAQPFRWQSRPHSRGSHEESCVAQEQSSWASAGTPCVATRSRH